jgi:hypothetical protein
VDESERHFIDSHWERNNKETGFTAKEQSFVGLTEYFFPYQQQKQDGT